MRERSVVKALWVMQSLNSMSESVFVLGFHFPSTTTFHSAELFITFMQLFTFGG